MAIKNKHHIAIIDMFKIYWKHTKENINDAIYFYNITNKLNRKYVVITKGFKNNYTIDLDHVTDYVQCMKIKILLSKHNNICVTTKQIFFNYKQIIMFLWIVSKVTNNVPNHIKLKIISLIATHQHAPQVSSLLAKYLM